MDDSIRGDPAKIAAWLADVRRAEVDVSGLVNTQTAEVSESGIDISQLRANLRLTSEQRLEKMVRAANYFASIRGAARRHTP